MNSTANFIATQEEIEARRNLTKEQLVKDWLSRQKGRVPDEQITAFLDGVDARENYDLHKERECPDCDGSGIIPEHNPMCDPQEGCEPNCPVPTPCPTCYIF